MTDSELETDKLPRHIGIIMDGNGRWAVKRGKLRTAGHKEGLEAAKRIVKAASLMGIEFVTLYTFSTENWKRTEEEVSFLMKLIRQHLKREMEFYIENGIRVVHSGDPEGLPASVRKEIRSVAEATAEFRGTSVNLAINYGGRDEIVRAVNRRLSKNGSGTVPVLTEDDIQSNLDLPDFPDPDLIIRTAGDQRLSNFLIWQCSYSEFYYSSKLWPDWDSGDLLDAVKTFQSRQRKFGGL